MNEKKERMNRFSNLLLFILVSRANETLGSRQLDPFSCITVHGLKKAPNLLALKGDYTWRWKPGPKDLFAIVKKAVAKVYLCEENFGGQWHFKFVNLKLPFGRLRQRIIPTLLTWNSLLGKCSHAAFWWLQVPRVEISLTQGYCTLYKKNIPYLRPKEVETYLSPSNAVALNLEEKASYITYTTLP